MTSNSCARSWSRARCSPSSTRRSRRCSIVAVFLVHPDLGFIVVASTLVLLTIAVVNQKVTHGPFGEANGFQSRANLHLDFDRPQLADHQRSGDDPRSGEDLGPRHRRLAQIADRRPGPQHHLGCDLEMLAPARPRWRCSAGAPISSIEGELTDGMVIAASIIAGRALAPVEGAIEGWHQFIQSRAAYNRISSLLHRLAAQLRAPRLPWPEGRLDVERLLYVPQGTKPRGSQRHQLLSWPPGDLLAIIGNSGAGKTDLGQDAGRLDPARPPGNVRLDLMDLRNWDQRQFGENIGYLPQDVQLFPASIKANIRAHARRRPRMPTSIRPPMLADVHEMIAFPAGL